MCFFQQRMALCRPRRSRMDWRATMTPVSRPPAFRACKLNVQPSFIALSTIGPARPILVGAPLPPVEPEIVHRRNLCHSPGHASALAIGRVSLSRRIDGSQRGVLHRTATPSLPFTSHDATRSNSSRRFWHFAQRRLASSTTKSGPEPFPGSQAEENLAAKMNRNTQTCHARSSLQIPNHGMGRPQHQTPQVVSTQRRTLPSQQVMQLLPPASQPRSMSPASLRARVSRSRLALRARSAREAPEQAGNSYICPNVPGPWRGIRWSLALS